MKGLSYLLILMLATVLMIQCIEPYNPPEIANDKTYLVVNAFMDSEKGMGTVVLSKTIPLNEPNVSPRETQAKVDLEIQNGPTFPFAETRDGTYTISGITLNQNPCRIRIKTSDEREFLSDYVMPKKTPAIDSLTYAVNEQDGLKISVTTHDPENKILFYRWRYEETSEYVSPYQSLFYYDTIRKAVFYRNTDDLNIFYCWKTEPSTQLLIANSKNLSEDVIDKFPITTLPLSSWKYKVKYSILVKQYAIDEAEYNYWNDLKKNTENTGTIFDPQPSMTIGNLHNITSPNEPVLGYFSVCSIAEKRIFIFGSIPFFHFTSPYDGVCESPVETIFLDDFNKDPTSVLLINGVYTPSGDLIGYTTSSSLCIDCRILVGGTNLKPDFWQ